MDIGNVSASLASAQTGDAVALLVLKKTMEVQAQAALQLVQSLPQPANNPPNLGNSVDSFA